MLIKRVEVACYHFYTVLKMSENQELSRVWLTGRQVCLSLSSMLPALWIIIIIRDF